MTSTARDVEKAPPAFEMTWGSSTSSGYCSEEEDSDGDLEQFFTARTSFFPTGRRGGVRQDDHAEEVKKELTVRDIQQKVKKFNSQIKSNLFMNMNKDGSYTGFIKVQLKLVRPVPLPPPKKGVEAPAGRRAGAGVKKCTSFLPKETSKHLHISSRTCAHEVIEALLKKFTVVDHPGKFALFECRERHNQVYLRKLSDDDCPLPLRLCAGPSEKTLSFVLKEKETGEVNWHAFSKPELKNFLQILQREEEEHVKQILRRYALARTKMQEALAGSTPG